MSTKNGGRMQNINKHRTGCTNLEKTTKKKKKTTKKKNKK